MSSWEFPEKGRPTFEISVIKGETPKILIKGEIVAGDAAHLKNILTNFGGNIDGGPLIEFDGFGEDYWEGMKNGREIF